MAEEVKVIDNFFPEELFKKFQEKIFTTPMLYGWKSNGKTDEHGHLNTKIINGGSSNLANMESEIQDEDVRKMWEFVKEYFKEDFALLRCYINGHTYGIGGYFHTDSKRNDELTTVLYLNKDWNPDWAGETVFLDDQNEIVKSVLPKENRLVIFPGNMQHCARAVSRNCTDLRLTFMFKARRKRTENFEKLSTFLYNNGATKHNHQLGTLHDHLVRCYNHLARRNYPDYLCFAAGLHSVFGTNVFKNNILTYYDEPKIVKEFGKEAFLLAKLFSVIKRPQTLETPKSRNDTSVFVEMAETDQLVELPINMYNDLCLIECANLFDQKSLNEERYPTLYSLWNQNLEKNK
jgi:SM-20-related protein